MKLKYKAYIAVAKSRERLVFHREHIDPVIHHAAAVGAVKRAYNLQKGGLARTARTHNRHYLPAVNVKVNARQHPEIVVTF